MQATQTQSKSKGMGESESESEGESEKKKEQGDGSRFDLFFLFVICVPPSTHLSHPCPSCDVQDCVPMVQ